MSYYLRMYSTETIGVAMGSAPALGLSLKQQLLFADRIAVADLDVMLQPEHRKRRSWPNSADDVEWLRDRGVLFNVPVIFQRDDADVPDFREAFERAGEATDRFRALDSKSDLSSHIQSIQEALTSRSYICRALAARLRARENMNAVSLLPVAEEGPESVATRDHVLRIVLGSIPVPNENTPFDDVLAFRSEHSHQLRGLRVWAADVAKGKLTGREVADKLQYLIAEYEEQLRLLRLNESRGRLEIVSTTIAEIAEHVVHLNVGTAAKTLFALRHEKTNLLSSERKLIGREVSYVVEAAKNFRSSGGGRLTAARD